jgi:3-phenylpropionate/trans-cinnamate dioxygenase ferredoxin reductase subunit
MARDGILVIIGGGLAGAKAAEGARANGFDGRVVLIGAEGHPPYERPPLSKALLRGEADPKSTLVHDHRYYAAHDIEIVTGHAAIALDVATRTVDVAGGTAVRFDTAVLATGATPRRLDVPGALLDGVHYLRNLDDSLRLGDAIRSASRVAVIGAGWIGTEVAASARQMGADVTLIDPGAVPLQRVLGADIGRMIARLHADNGVALRLGTAVAELQGAGRVEQVVLGDGRIVPADLVVVGVGVTPRLDLAVQAGLRVDNGVVVDEFLETSAPGIYAAGDIANAFHPRYGTHLRVEHWANALNQGLTVGRNVAGQRESYERLPYFFSDQYDLGLEYIGQTGPHDAIVVRGDVEDRKFIAFWHHNGMVNAAMNVNVWDVADDLKVIVNARRPIDPLRLSDASVALDELARDGRQDGSSSMPGDIDRAATADRATPEPARGALFPS